MKKAKLLGVLLVSCAFMAFALGSESSGSGSTTSTKVGEVLDKIEDGVSEKIEEATEIKFENPDKVYVGDVCMDGDVKITYIKSGEYREDNQFLKPKDGYKYVFIELYAENTGNSDATLSSFSFEGYADGYSVDQYYSGTDFSGTLSAGRTMTGSIVYEVPNDATEIEMEYSLSFWTSDNIKFVYEGDKDSGFVPEANTTVSEDAYRKGDILETKDLRITYIDCGQFTSDNMFIQPKEGFKYLYIELEIENISDKDQSVSSFSFDCYADGAACDQTYYTGDDSLDAKISAGRKTKGKVVFEIPNEATTVEFEYLDNYWTSGRVKFLYE